MSEKRRGLFNRMFSTNGSDEEPSPETVARWLSEPDGSTTVRPRGYQGGSQQPGSVGLDGGQQRAFNELARGFAGGGGAPSWAAPEEMDDEDEEGAGVEIAGVGSSGPLAQAGVREGDVIVAVDGQPVDTESDLAAALGTLQPGRSATLEIVRGEATITTIVVAPG